MHVVKAGFDESGNVPKNKIYWFQAKAYIRQCLYKISLKFIYEEKSTV